MKFVKAKFMVIHRNFFLQFIHIPLFLGLLFVAML